MADDVMRNKNNDIHDHTRDLSTYVSMGKHLQGRISNRTILESAGLTVEDMQNMHRAALNETPHFRVPYVSVNNTAIAKKLVTRPALAKSKTLLGWLYRRDLKAEMNDAIFIRDTDPPMPITEARIDYGFMNCDVGVPHVTEED